MASRKNQSGKSPVRFLIVPVMAALIVGGIFLVRHIMEERRYDKFREQQEAEWEAFKEARKNAGSESSSGKSAEVTVAAYGTGQDTTVGDLAGTGYRFDIQNGTFDDGSRVSVTPLTAEILSRIEDREAFTLIGNPVEVKCDTYNGAIFSSDVIYTVPIPDGAELDRLVFMYFDGETGEHTYLWPDGFDLSEHSMWVRLPHFSQVAEGELSEEGQIEAFLDKYAKKLAVERDERKQAAEALEPYVRAKVEALQLTKEAEKDLIQSAVNFLGSRFKGDSINPNEAGDLIESGTGLTTGMLRAVLEGDKEGIKGSMNDAATFAVMNSWSELGYSEKLSKVMKNDTAGPTLDAVLSNTNALARMSACMTEKDWDGAAKELASIMTGLDPKVDLITKAVTYGVRQADLAFIKWKSNQIEELYRIYKNGGEEVWGNYVIAGDKETFLEYLSTASGFGGGKMTERFYNLDQIKEVCDRYGWSFEDYKELAEKYRDVFETRARDALLDYFDTRLAQEAEAEKIKEDERINVEEMLKNGLLKASHFSDFFGEHALGRQFNLEDRMERLMETRSFLSQFVDEEALLRGARRGEFNWGDLLRWWATDVTEYGRQEALQRFLKYLQQYDLLKDGMERLIRDEEAGDVPQQITEELAEKNPQEETGSEPPKEKTGYWKLKQTTVTPAKNEIGEEGYASWYYGASELTHTVNISRPSTDYHGSGYASFTVTCSAPPKIINPGEDVFMDVSIQMDYGGDYMLWSAYGSVEYGKPNDEREAIMYNAGIDFEPTVEGEKDSAYLDTIGNWPCPEVHVKHAFEKGYSTESEMAILFYGGGSNTLWIYGWVEE